MIVNFVWFYGKYITNKWLTLCCLYTLFFPPEQGSLDYIERQSAAGHVLTVIDEKQEKVEDCNIWYNGYYYKPNDDGDIVIPYREASGQKSSHLYINHEGFTSRQQFSHNVESYEMSLACHVDTEALIAGSSAKVNQQSLLPSFCLCVCSFRLLTPQLHFNR